MHSYIGIKGPWLDLKEGKFKLKNLSKNRKVKQCWSCFFNPEIPFWLFVLWYIMVTFTVEGWCMYITWLLGT